MAKGGKKTSISSTDEMVKQCKEQPPTASAKDLRVDSKMNVFDSLFEVKHNGSNGPIALDPLKQREPKHSRKTIPALPRSTYGFLYSRVWWRFTVSYAKMTFKVFGIAAVMMFVWVFLNAKLMDSLPSIYPAKRLETIKQPSSESIVRRTRELDRILTQRDSPVIHLMWTTPSSTFSFLNYKVLDSYLYHDAFTSIIIHATHLNESHFRSYTQAGYRVTVKKLTDESILDLATTPTSPSPNPCPGVEWLHNMPLYRKTSPYFYSHLTDYLRFCILYKHGGIYSDFDAIQLSRWNHPDEDSSSPIGNAFIGADSATGAETPNLGSSTIINHENGHHPIKVSSASSSAPHQKTPVCPWCFHHGDTYLAPGVMGTPPSHPLVHRALEIGFERMVYDPLAFNAVGPKAVTLAFQELEREGGGHVDGVQVLKRGLLYPYSYLTSWRVFRRVEVPSGTRETTAESGFDMAAAETTVEAAVDRISRNSLSLHLYGHVTKGLKVEDGSMLDYLVRKQTVVIQGSVLGLNGSHDGGSTEWIGHKLKAPRFLSVARYVELVPDVRITVDTRGLEESDKIMVSLKIYSTFGRLRIAQKGLSDAKFQSSLQIDDVTPAEANSILSHLVYNAYSLPEHVDNITISANIFVEGKPTKAVTLTSTVPVYNLPNLLTVMVKTTDRMSKVFTLVSSVLTHYPNMTIIVADDGHLDPAKTTKPEGPQRGFYYLPLPHDVGLSAGRNRMVDRVATKYLLTLDDDFTLTRDSPLAALLHALESRRGDSYDIAAGKIPADEGRFGVDYCGAMNVSEGRTLQLREGALGVHEGCLEVEFVPNVFVARTQFLREVLRWDETLKLGEHEDFFWRAKKLGAKVLTCPGVTFYHDQVAHWKGVTEYDRKRSRVFDFMKLALRKHNFSRLVSFGRTVMDLVLPAPASEVQVSEVLARSIKLSWRSPAASFKVLQSSDNGLHWAPVNYGQGENYEHVPQEISREPDGFQRHPDSMNWLSVYGLKPGVHYQFRIHAGNRFSFREGGVEISATTLTLRNENVRNLLENPSFESGSTSPYRISQNNTFAFVPIVNMDSADGALVKFKRSSSTGFRSEVTTVGYLFAHRTLAAIAQVVPGLRFASPRLVPGGMAREAGTGEMGRIILASMQSRVDALFDGDGMSWRANLKVWFKKHGSVSVCEMAEGEGEWNGTREPLLEWGMPDIEVKEEFDRSNLEWQGRTLSVCVAEGWMERVRAVELAGILETYRGSVTYDDWVLVTN